MHLSETSGNRSAVQDKCQSSRKLSAGKDDNPYRWLSPCRIRPFCYRKHYYALPYNDVFETRLSRSGLDIIRGAWTVDRKYFGPLSVHNPFSRSADGLQWQCRDSEVSR